MRVKQVTVFLLALVFFAETINAAVPWYAWVGASFSGARLACDPASPSAFLWFARKIEWFDRPQSAALSATLKGLRERLAAALKLMKEDYQSPRRQELYKQYTDAYNVNLQALEQERNEKKRSYLSYLIEKSKIKKAYEKQLDGLEIDKVSPFWAWVRWGVMVQNIWSSWWHCYKYSFNLRLSNLTAYVVYVEGKLV